MKYLFFSFILLLVISFGLALAIPQKISFQGVLKDSAGNLVTASKDITFRIYDVASGGTSLWGETQTVSVEAGLYTVELGSVTTIPLTLFNGDTRYLAIEVDGAQLSPRIIILSVPYAYRANYADTAGSTGPSGDAVLFCPTTAQTTTSAFAINIKSSAAGTPPVIPGGSPSYAPVISVESTGAYGIAVVGAGGDTGIGGAFSGYNGVYALTTTATGHAVHGQATASDGYGVYGRTTSTTGTNYAVYGRTESSTGFGVYGRAASATGTNYGVYGETNSLDGVGVFGRVNAASGGTGIRGRGGYYGGYFEATETTGRGIETRATASSGSNTALYARTESPDGYAGYFSGGKGVLVNGTLEVTSDFVLASTLAPPPPPPSTDFAQGTIRWDQHYIYVYTGPGPGWGWRRATLEAIP